MRIRAARRTESGGQGSESPGDMLPENMTRRLRSLLEAIGERSEPLPRWADQATAAANYSSNSS